MQFRIIIVFLQHILILIDMEKKQIIEAMHNRLHEIDPHAKAILFPALEVQNMKEVIGMY